MTDILRHDPATVWAVPSAFAAIYSHAVEIPPAARLLLVSGQIGVAPDGVLQSGFRAQCEQAMANVEALLTDTGLRATDMVKVTYYLVDRADLPALTSLRQDRWSSPNPPAVTTLVVAALARPDLLVEIEVMAAAR
jgi:2-iminobutanoate/2-iminopropanoate deaminase